MELQIPNFFVLYLYVMILVLSTNLFHPTTQLVNAFRNETDKLALLKFKEAVVNDPHGSLNSWNDSTHFCKWQGITCGAKHQRVISLLLQDHDLHGTVSPYIGNLSFLRYIYLRNNSFYGTIPHQLDRLFRLRYLNLNGNMLEGAIPVNLTFCRELSTIDYGNNSLTGEIPSELGSLKKLVYINLGNNNLTGSIPPSTGNISSLTVLHLAYNNLAGNFPEDIGRLRNLFYFSISFNKLSGTISAPIFNLSSSMKTFSISGNEFSGTIPPAMAINMPNLQEIYLGGNHFSGHIPDSISNATQLKHFDIVENNFVGKVPTTFGDLPHLSHLKLSENSLGNYLADDLEFITALTNCSKLWLLEFGYNKFGGVLPNSVANLSTELTDFYIGHNQISGTIPEALANLNNLIILSMWGNMFTGVIPHSFGKFQKMQALGFGINRLSGSIPSSIGNLTQLFSLYLSGNELEGSIPPSIGNCLYMQMIYMSENRLSGEIPPQIIGLSSLQFLNLSHNSLNGSLHAEVGKLKNINALDVSENHLTGEIPAIIGDCRSLQYLFLQGNLFQDIIPSSLASLKGLQSLDLSRNNLSGKIPKDLERLQFLQYLNFSFNNLEGEVPKEGVFLNMSAVSLAGNAKLCGGISKLHLPACSIGKKSHHGFKWKLTLAIMAGCFLLLLSLSAIHLRRKSGEKPSTVVLSTSSISKISYKALYKATGGFSPSTLIGSGGFGSVYKGILDEKTNDVVAIKVLNLQHRGASKSFTAECNALRNTRHRNLVKILTCCSSIDYKGNEFKALVFEYMSNGSLEEWLHTEIQPRSLNLLQRLNIAIDAASALCYLHAHCEPHIIHCDIKPSNVLLDDDMVAYVGDFGLARLISTTTTDNSQNQSSTIGIKGTIGYAAPEYASGGDVSRQGDVYSYGILVLEMFTGRRPTDELFRDGLNLHNFVKMAISTGTLLQIVDPTLLATLGETTYATTESEVNDHNDYNIDIKAEEEGIDYENLGNMNTYVCECILPILKIGLACSEELSMNRMSMEDVTKHLHHIKNAYASRCWRETRRS